MTREEMVKSLRACAGFGGYDGCKYCAKEFGYGCARDLKIEAAAMIEETSEERKTEND